MRQIYPQVNFKLNKWLDKWVGVSFLNRQKGGRDFGASILKYHPDLSPAKALTSKEQQRFICTYVDDFYKTHLGEIKKTTKIFQTQWDEKAKDFFELAGKIFNHHPWPKGKYVAYLSIFPCGPRFLQNKTFQVFYLTKRGAPLSSSHEMLHFLFYDYFENTFPKINSNQDKVWKLSEILNVFVLDSDELRSLFGMPHPSSYPDHLVLIEKLRREWEGKNNLKTFLRRSLEIIEKESQKLSAVNLS